MELYDGLACLNLSDGMPPRERRIFQHAPSLMRLAQFIQDANATHRLGQPFLRMVVVGPEVEMVAVKTVVVMMAVVATVAELMAEAMEGVMAVLAMVVVRVEVVRVE